MRFEAQGTVPPQMERHRLRASCHPRRQEEGEGWRQRSRVYAEEWSIRDIAAGAFSLDRLVHEYGSRSEHYVTLKRQWRSWRITLNSVLLQSRYRARPIRSWLSYAWGA